LFKNREMLFAEIPGLEDVKRTLIGSVANNHIAHAQLFAGKEGSANMALALAYSTYIHCENRQENDSCGQCASCSKTAKLIHPDVHFVFPVNTNKAVTKDPASALFMKDWRNFLIQNPYAGIHSWGEAIGTENKQLIINTEDSKNIIKTLALKSFEGEYKIMIIWLPELMKTEGANAILKILEEPPAKTLFLMVSNNIDKLLTTIQSRTQKVMIPSFSDTEIKNHITSLHQLEDKTASRIAFLADGNMDAAIRMTGEPEETNHDMFRDWMRLCFILYRKSSNLTDLNQWSEAFAAQGREAQKNLLQYGINILRETLVFKHTDQQLVRLQQEDLKFVEGFAKVMSDEMIETISRKLNDMFYHIERNASAKITFMEASFYIASVFNKKQ
jgi:DNA polymerase-3 subunit delta'